MEDVVYLNVQASYQISTHVSANVRDENINDDHIPKFFCFGARGAMFGGVRLEL